MPDLTTQFLDKENFYIAFKKISHFFRQSDEWYDPVKLSEYEATLPMRIKMLRDKLENREYHPNPIQPLPFPKRNLDNGKHRIRPYYTLHLDDQLVWTALVNVIGDLVEEKMSSWSFGNRLYQPVWYEENDVTGKSKLIKGSCKNTSENLYRKWNQSWPLYKRYISMTIKIMSKTSKFSIKNLEDDKELEIFEQAQKAKFYQDKYFDKNFWQEGYFDKLCWTGLDFQSFFPSVNPSVIYQNIKKCLVKDDGTQRDDVDTILLTIQRMLQFPLDVSGWNRNYLKAKNSYGFTQNDTYSGLPTGLLVAGFLANVSVMEIDQEVDTWIKENRNVAIFKYVDDHIILAQSQKGLLDFLNFYHGLLKRLSPSIKFQPGKIQPKECLQYNVDKGFSIIVKKQQALEVDVEFPSPLMTNTLKKVSNINKIDFDLVEDGELGGIEADLGHLLLTDFPSTEIRKDTKVSFAAGKLCLLANQIKPNFNIIDPISAVSSEKITLRYEYLINELKDKLPSVTEELKELKSKLRKQATHEYVNGVFEHEINNVNKRHAGIFKLLIKSVRENPDKIKLWKRCIEFCFLTGYDGLVEIFEVINECAIHNESQKYISSYCLLNIQICLEKAFSQADNNTTLFWKTYCAWKFISNVFKMDENKLLVKNNRYPFSIKTVDNYKIVKQFIYSQTREIPHRLISNNLAVFNEILSNDFLCIHENESLTDQKRYSEEFIWYFLSRTKLKRREDFFSNNVSDLNLINPLSWSILSIFPKLLPANKFQEAINFINNNGIDDLKVSEMRNFSTDNGFTYEIFSLLRENKKEDFDLNIKHYSKIQLILDRSTDKFISLDKWLYVIVSDTAKKHWIDPKLSEWTLIEIIKQISTCVDTEINNEKSVWGLFDTSYHLIHPANYLIPIEWLTSNELGWDKWKAITKEHPIKLANKNEIIHDYRYFPISNLWNSNGILYFGNKELPIVIGLSVLFVKLLSKSFDWPATANKVNFIDQLYANAYMTIESETLSSALRILLGSIFSKTKVDIIYHSESIELNERRSIRTLKDFIKYLSEIQKHLEDLQVIISNREPRQLIYINIDDLNNSRDKFFEKQ